MSRWRRTAGVFLVFGAAHCSRRSAPPDRAGPVDAEATLQTPTTSAPAIALSNLDAEISDREKKARAGDLGARIELVARYLTRAEFVGRVDDLAAADTTSATAVAAAPSDARARLARAKAMAAIHEFDQAATELDAAARLGAGADDVAHARVSILLATGRDDEAAALEPKGDELLPAELVIRGATAARVGAAGESERLFELARTRFHDVSPFVFAWMDFERARALEVAGERAKASAYLTEAAAVLPCYAHAVVHLAALEPAERALPRLERVARTSDDPDVVAAMADAMRRLGRRREAAAEAARALSRFDEVLARLPKAYAGHAATFFLGMGSDPRRALELAKADAANRPTAEAVELWLSAAQAAGSFDETCAAAARANSLPHVPNALQDRATKAAKRCR